MQLELPLGLRDEGRRPGTKKGIARWAADCAVDRIRDRFGWDAIGYASSSTQSRLVLDAASTRTLRAQIAKRGPNHLIAVLALPRIAKDGLSSGGAADVVVGHSTSDLSPGGDNLDLDQEFER